MLRFEQQISRTALILAVMALSMASAPAMAQSGGIRDELIEVVDSADLDAERYDLEMLKVPAADQGSASVIVHYMGDSNFELLFQEQLKLKRATQGYDRVVLLKFDEELSPWLDWAEADERNADIIDVPTLSNVRKYLKELADEGYYIDLWIFGHGFSGGEWRLSRGTYADNMEVQEDQIADLAVDAGYKKLPIRMVWSTLCYGADQNTAWREAGAIVVSGSRWVNFYPTNFNKFAKKWNAGMEYGDALRESEEHTGLPNTFFKYICAPLDRYQESFDNLLAAVEYLVNLAGVFGESVSLPGWANEDFFEMCTGDWEPKCSFGKTVGGTSECARAYFADADSGANGPWIEGSNWQSGSSGIENMEYSSRKLLEGDDTMTKDRVPSWR